MAPNRMDWVRSLNRFLSDARLLKSPTRWLRNALLKERSWMWKVRDAVADLAPLQASFAKGVSISVSREGTFVKAVDGLEYLFDFYPATMMPTRLLRGEYPVDQSELDFIAKKVPKGAVIVDAGAGVGEYAMNFARLGYQVYAFEPFRAAYEVLRKNVAKNGVKLKAVNLGVWEETGTFGITAPSVDDNRLVPLSDSRVSEEIHAVRLDDYFSREGIQKIDFIKADVQGAELMMLYGLGKYMDSRPKLFLEIVPRCTRKFGYEYADIFRYLSSLGYKATGFYEDGSTHQEPFEEMIRHSYNFYFEV